MGTTRIDLSDSAFPENTRAVIHLKDAATKVGPGVYRKRILTYGKWNHTAAPDGVLEVDLAYGQRLVKNFAGKVFDAVKITKGHPKTEAEALDLATGDVIGLEAEPDGVYALLTATSETAARIDDGSIVGCSAGIIPDYTDHAVGGAGNVGPVLEHLALTNTPYIKGLGDFSPVHLASKSDAVLLSRQTQPEDTAMTREELLAAAKAAGIDIESIETAAATTATEADKATIKELETKLAALPAKVDPDPTAEEAAKTEAKAEATQELVTALGEALGAAKIITLAEGETPTLKGVVEGIVASVTEGREAKATLNLTEAEGDVDKAIREGKVLPANRDGHLAIRLSQGHDAWAALVPAAAIVKLNDELGTIENPDDGTDVDAEIERLYALAEPQNAKPVTA